MNEWKHTHTHTQQWVKRAKLCQQSLGKMWTHFRRGGGRGEKGSTNLLKQETSTKQCRFKSLSTALQLSNCFLPALCSPLCCFSDSLSAIGCTTNNNNITIKAAALQQKLLACLLYPSPSPLRFPFPFTLSPSLSLPSLLSLSFSSSVSHSLLNIYQFSNSSSSNRGRKRERRGDSGREREW